jgi:hypothetical protein
MCTFLFHLWFWKNINIRSCCKSLKLLIYALLSISWIITRNCLPRTSMVDYGCPLNIGSSKIIKQNALSCRVPRVPCSLRVAYPIVDWVSALWKFLCIVLLSPPPFRRTLSVAAEHRCYGCYNPPLFLYNFHTYLDMFSFRITMAFLRRALRHIWRYQWGNQKRKCSDIKRVQGQTLMQKHYIKRNNEQLEPH